MKLSILYSIHLLLELCKYPHCGIKKCLLLLLSLLLFLSSRKIHTEGVQDGSARIQTSLFRNAAAVRRRRERPSANVIIKH